MSRITVVMAADGWMARLLSESATHDLVLTLQHHGQDGSATVSLFRCSAGDCADAIPVGVAPAQL